jgi:hypothetical protein
MRSECGDVLYWFRRDGLHQRSVAIMADVTHKAVRLKHVSGPLGIRGKKTRVASSLIRGIEKTHPLLPLKSRRRGSATAC